MEASPKIAHVYCNTKKGVLILQRDFGASWRHYDAYRPDSQIDILRELLGQLQKQDSGFARRLVELHDSEIESHKERYRRYVAIDAAVIGDHAYDRVGELYVTKDALLSPVLKQACEVAGVPLTNFKEGSSLPSGW